MNIIFMGSPEFAISSINSIYNSKNHKISAVVTIPDKPKGRGKKLLPSKVKIFAEEYSLNLFQPVKLNDDNFISEIISLKPDIIVTAAFRILPESVFGVPKFGALNVHASFLPKYRGPAPVHWAIINGEKETGVTIFQIDKGIDTGGILGQEKVKIRKNETSGELSSRLSLIGANLLLKILDRFESGSLEKIPQTNESSTKAPKITKEFTRLDWKNDSSNITNKINGLSPKPSASSYCKNKNYKFLRAANVNITYPTDVIPGTIIEHEQETGLIIKCGKNAVSVLDIQREGKNPMEIKEFLKGSKLKKGDQFEYHETVGKY